MASARAVLQTVCKSKNAQIANLRERAMNMSCYTGETVAGNRWAEKWQRIFI